jgi:hypothetical protein
MEIVMSRKNLKEMSQSSQGIGSKSLLSRQDRFQLSHNLRLYPGEQLIQKEKAETYPLAKQYGISAHVRVRIFQWHEVSVHVHEASVHVHEASVHVHESSVHVHEVSVHVHEASVHVHEVSVHVHGASVHLPKSIMQREKTVFFPGSTPLYKAVPIIDVSQFKNFKITKGVNNGRQTKFKKHYRKR